MGKVRKGTESIDRYMLIVEYLGGTIELHTTNGRIMQVDSEGRSKLIPIKSLCSTSNDSTRFQLLRVSDMLDKVMINKEDEDESRIRDKIFPKEEAEEERECLELAQKKELWILRSVLCGSFLRMNSGCGLVLSSEPSFWQPDEHFGIVHTSDFLGRRQHNRRMWKCESVAYVSKMRKKYSAFSICFMTIEQALNLTKHLLANPFSISTVERSKERVPPSIRTLVFHTAELARKEGHPDWIQFVALVHGLAGALMCLQSSDICHTSSIPVADKKTQFAGKGFCDSLDYDWTIFVDSIVLGCRSSENSMFAEFRHLSPDSTDARYNTPNGIYGECVGLEQVLVRWASCDYMYMMMKHNDVRLPEEAFTILKLFPLVDWHSRGEHTSLSSETDEELKPFVAGFYEMFERSRDAVVHSETCESSSSSSSSSSSKDLSDDDCKELWKNHYSFIVNKYGAGGFLEW